MAYGTVNADKMTTSDGVSSSGLYGFKNRIINGAMVVSQRNGTSSVTINSAAWTYTVDRFCCLGQGSDGVYTVQQSSTAPAGFVNSLLITVTTADSSIGAGQIYTLRQTIEGYNIADLNWGSANSQPITLSFWVRSSVTGTFSGCLNNEGTASYPFTYTISSANTWEQKTVTVTGPTSGTWGSTNSNGIRITWSLGVGTTYSGTANTWNYSTEYFAASSTTNLIATNGATFYITGVQLEKGSTATSFDYRPYGTELALCQRYYENNYGIGYAVGSAQAYPGNYGVFFQGFNTTNGQKHVYDWFKVPKRAVPTVTYYDFAGNSGKMSSLDVGGTATNNVAIGYTPLNQNNLASGATATWYGAGFFWVASAEL